MNYNLFLNLILGLVVISTLCICGIKPQMHNSVLLIDSNYKLEQVEQEDIPVVEDNIQTQVVAEKKIEAVKPQTVQYPVKTNVEKNVKTMSVPIEKIQQVKVQTKSVSKPQEVKVVSQKPVVAKQTKIVEQIPMSRQEQIDWNLWRSNIQNQIMKEAKIVNVPYGTVFKFTFTVDKYGKVSNVKTWSLNPAYTPHAIQCIAPVIRSFQGHSILDFPKSSNRVITNVDGGFKISQRAKFSTPNDYNDVETITK